MTEELMLGNWVIDTSGKEEVYAKVDHFAEWGIVNYWSEGGYGDAGYMDSTTNEYLKPIPLSSEALMKAGFSKHPRSNEYWNFWILPNKWYISEALHSEPSAGVEEGKFYHGDNYTEIKSLHHLQNYYFITTGLKLDIKL